MIGRVKPRYQAVKDLVIERISRGELKAGDRVPSENELVEAAGVSRMTANRALRELTDEGYVNRVMGSGTFVADFRANSDLLEVRNIAAEIAMRGHQHSARVLALNSARADSTVAAALSVAIDDAVHHVSLVHYEGDVPIQLEDRFVVAGFAPQFLKQDFANTTPSAYLSDISPLQEAEHVVRAELPTAAIRKHLHMNRQEACLVVERRTWNAGRPVTFGRLYHPGSRFELTGHYKPPGRSSDATAGIEAKKG